MISCTNGIFNDFFRKTSKISFESRFYLRLTILDNTQVPQCPSVTESKEIHHPKPSKKWTKKDADLELASYVLINGKLSSDSIQSILYFFEQFFIIICIFLIYHLGTSLSSEQPRALSLSKKSSSLKQSQEKGLPTTLDGQIEFCQQLLTPGMKFI